MILERKRPPLTVDHILAWADVHHGRTGQGPNPNSGTVRDALGESWYAIDYALRRGYLGLPGDASLSWLLAENGRGG
jgi:hypothetical protein